MASLESLPIEMKLEIVKYIDDISNFLNLKSANRHWYGVIQEYCARQEDELTIGLRLPTTIAASHGVSIYDYHDWAYQTRFRYMFIFIFSFRGTEFYCPVDTYVDDTWWAKIRGGDHTAIDQAFAEMDRGLHAIYAKAMGLVASRLRTFRERRNFWTAFWLSVEAEGRLEEHRHPRRTVSGPIRAPISGAENAD